MHSQTSIDNLQHTTKNIIQALDQNQDQESLRQFDQIESGISQFERCNDEKLQNIR